MVGVVVLAVAGFWFVSDRNGEVLPDMPAAWETYESDEFGFTLEHPPEATVQQEAERYIKFTYLGGPQATGEVTDGFTFTVGTHAREGDLAAFAEAYYEDQLRAGSPVSPPEETELNGRSAYRYEIETLGVVTVYVVAGGDTRAHTLSYIVADPRDEGYQQHVDRMRASFETTSPSGAQGGETVDTVSLAVLDITDEGTGERYGCDFVAYVERSVAPTSAPLTAALQELFAVPTTDVDGYYNFIARTHDTLSFARAEVQNGAAHIYLEGELSGLTGVCDDPRTRIQIEQTALQFATVDDVVLYLNGEPTDLVPSQR